MCKQKSEEAKSEWKNENDKAWTKLFARYDVLRQIESQGSFHLSAQQMKEFREPRLMAKLDHRANLPSVFAKNKLAILPITRGNYMIADFNAYHSFEPDVLPLEKFSLPDHIQSLNCHAISSEAVALNCALVSGIMADFLEEKQLVPTVAGRMGTDTFRFQIQRSVGKGVHDITVKNAQMEIDAAYEGQHSLTILEAKNELSKDFLIRQLYYPYAVWRNRVMKRVRPIFLIYSNGIYRLYEYQFTKPDNYSSLQLVKQKNYSLEDTAISARAIQEIFQNVSIVEEATDVPFPQANTFERVINLCELLNERELNREEITDQYAFTFRQTDYYTNAARYLGLLEKDKQDKKPIYSLSDRGKQLLYLSFKQRQLAYCQLILSHQTFHETFARYLQYGAIPEKREVVSIMEKAHLTDNVNATTIDRRASTIRSWVAWIAKLGE